MKPTNSSFKTLNMHIFLRIDKNIFKLYLSYHLQIINISMLKIMDFHENFWKENIEYLYMVSFIRIIIFYVKPI